MFQAGRAHRKTWMTADPYPHAAFNATSSLYCAQALALVCHSCFAGVGMLSDSWSSDALQCAMHMMVDPPQAQLPYHRPLEKLGANVHALQRLHALLCSNFSSECDAEAGRTLTLPD